MADETPNQSAKATSKDPLPVVLKAALAHVERADKADKSAADHRVSAGLRFKELKDRVAAGEARDPSTGGKVTWANYCAANIPQLDQRTVERYIAIAEGEVSNTGASGASASTDWSSPAEEEEIAKADYNRAWADARRHHGVKCSPEDAFQCWRLGTGRPDHPTSRDEWNSLCDHFNGGKGKVWDWKKESPYQFWRKARGFPDDAKSRAIWEKDDTTGNRSDVDGSAKSSTTSEKRKAQYTESRRRQRAKASSIREANGGKASKPRMSTGRMDKETSEQYQKLASIAKVLNAGQLQIINEIIEERWPGTEEKARAAKAQRDKAGE
jgi:hypothetical protein